jgi:37-kD nucleoid-associated bacterial protein
VLVPPLQQLRVDSAIVHRVPRRLTMADRAVDPDSEPLPELTDAVVDLDAVLAAFLQRRLVRTMEQAFAVRFQAEPESRMPSLVCDTLASRRSLVRRSREMAEELHSAQQAINPEGLLVVIAGMVSDRPYVAVLKLEHESGVRSEIVDDHGKRRFRITVERELVMTDKTRIFKAGLFFDPGSRPLAPGDVEAWVSDDQASKAGTPVARFFRETYLGCDFVRAPSLDTQDYYNAGVAWINGLDDPEKQTRYHTALISDLSSNVGTVTPRTFADEHLEVDDRQRFLDQLPTTGAPTTRFTKDTERISNQLRRTSMTTDHGVLVTAPPAAVDDGTVAVNRGRDDDPDTITITDRIRRVAGG